MELTKWIERIIPTIRIANAYRTSTTPSTIDVEIAISRTSGTFKGSVATVYFSLKSS